VVVSSPSVTIGVVVVSVVVVVGGVGETGVDEGGDVPCVAGSFTTVQFGFSSMT
jgi:hypothetical protein